MTTTITVSNSAQLAATLQAAANAATPETILLEGGTYSLKALSNLDPTANVTIESASSSNQAAIQGLQISHSSNITFNDLAFASRSGTPTGDMAMSYFDNNVNFTNDSFSGPVSSSYVSAPVYGLVVCDSTNSTVSGSTFQYVQNGIAEKENNGITISSNTFTNIFGDATDNAASWNVQILNNNFSNIHIDSSDGQHSDAIQFWTSGEKTAGGNITIEGNTYNIGSGAAAQGIFMTDQVGGLTYSNVTIENNDLVGTAWNGITLQDVSHALVENNTLQSVIGTGQISRLTLAGGVSGLVENNKIGGFENEGVNSATVTGDTILPPISLPSHAGSLVSSMASLGGPPASLSMVSSQQLAAFGAFGASFQAVSPPRA
ncbi:MAG: right-handed parallel beta-helix repeat-containing protein [Caulobacteraceae bacterium]|nr:right-handed parallel beta-helix repeat-containing protein [Caulobacteraceae bacterium]